MEKQALKPYLVVLALMAATSAALAYSVDVTTSNEAGIRVYLPDRVNNWTGVELRYCLSAACQSTFLRSELEDPDSCSKCAEPLSSMSFSEYQLLPKDTIILRKQYTHTSGDVVFASIVLSGKERASIHRPQVCLVGQGNQIVQSTRVPVPIEGRGNLDVMVLDMHKNWTLANGTTAKQLAYYAYWFVGKGRETPYHLQRMLWMATDRIFHSVSHRWAYIAVSGNREDGNEEHMEAIKAFVSELYPEMLPADEATDPRQLGEQSDV